jgi:hypothetical protein
MCDDSAASYEHMKVRVEQGKGKKTEIRFSYIKHGRFYIRYAAHGTLQQYENPTVLKTIFDFLYEASRNNFNGDRIDIISTAQEKTHETVREIPGGASPPADKNVLEIAA